MTEENSRRGRSNRASGQRALRSGREWLQAHGAGDADYRSEAHSSDYVGVGELAIERTTEPWQQIGKKADQAAADARRRGVRLWCVWKPRRGIADQGKAWCVTEFAQWWSLYVEVTQLRAQVRQYRAAFGPIKEAAP
jgi:hypothetical protein